MTNAELILILAVSLFVVALAREIPHPTGSRIANAIGGLGAFLVVVVLLLR